MKFDFAVFVKNNQSLLELVEWLHSNKQHHSKFECSTLSGFVVVLVYEGDYEVLKQASQYGALIIIPRQGGEVK
jgi:hypothetical protein